MQLKDVLWDIDIVHADRHRFATYCFTPDGGKVGSIDDVSIDNIGICDGAVFQHVKTYHCLEVLFVRACDHPHEAAGTFCIFDLFLGVAFEVVMDSVDVHRVLESWRFGTSRIHQKESCLGVLMEIDIVEAVRCGFKFDIAMGGCNDEHTAAILAIVSNWVFAAQAEKRENIGNAIAVEVNFHPIEITHFIGKHCAFVAMNYNGFRCRANVGHVMRVCEKVNRGLTIKKKKI